ncbi:MAG: hypothetical protein P4L50_23715 [Anaerolineaceae bacterium]|nr:hypothetical protein [Anaerolineaceae bacterium]
MQKNLEIKKEIYASVIATILTMVFIEPILKFLWNGMIWFSSIFYEGFINEIYIDAALGQRNDIDEMIFILFCALIIGSAIAFILMLVNLNPLNPLNSFNQLIFNKIHITKKTIRIIGVISSVLLIIATLFLVTDTFAVLQLNTSFQQRITVLAPRISETEYKELLASWASMKSRADYELIVTQMNTLADQNNIILPPLLLD